MRYRDNDPNWSSYDAWKTRGDYADQEDEENRRSREERAIDRADHMRDREKDERFSGADNQ